MKVALLGYRGKVGRVLAPALEAAGHELRTIGRDDPVDLDGLDAAIDFTTPAAGEANARQCIAQGVHCIVGTSGVELGPLAAAAEERRIVLLQVPNFALGAVLMMQFARQAASYLPRAEIIELHNEAKVDAPSGTAKRTASLLGGDPAIHSVRLPGLVAHQEVLFGGEGQLLTIRHDAFSRDAYVPGVLLALEKLETLPPGLTVGLDALLG